MDELVKGIKVIRLRDEELGEYLTASEDKVSITLSSPHKIDGFKPENTEWKLEWLKGPQGLVGHVRLWSIYDKVLSFDKDPLKYTSRNACKALCQKSGPPVAGGDAEWRLELRRKDNRSLIGHLLKWSEKFGECMALTVLWNGGEDKPPALEFNAYYRKALFRWFNISRWMVEVVATPRKKDVDQTHHHHHYLQTQGSLQTDYENKAVGVPASICPGQIVSSSTGSHGQGPIGDQVMSLLSKWQVGQVYLQMSASPTGGGYSNYNSGGNVNGSGVQRNGDVTVSNEFGRSQDNKSMFVNY